MDRLAEVCDQVAKYRSRIRKVQLLAEYLRPLPDDDFALAVQFLTDGPVLERRAGVTLFDFGETARLSIGHSTLREAAQKACGWDVNTMRVCFQEVGDTGETIGLLMEGKSRNEALSLGQANALYQELFLAPVTARRVELLAAAFGRHRPLTVKYVVKVITGNLRIGLLEKMVEEAVAASCGVASELVRAANNRMGNLSRVALAARRGELEQVEARLFHPMDFMLAKPLDRLDDLPAPGQWLVEDKYDGIRSQVHVEAGVVRIFSRGQGEITHSFPEIAAALRGLKKRAIMDGEILAWRDGRALSFNVLQQRIARKQVKAALLRDVPVIFMGYDLLLEEHELLLSKPIEERRERLRGLLNGAFEMSPERLVHSHAEVEQLFAAARDRGNEGLLLKRRGSLYEPGKRGGAWLKLKRPFGTLDVVITAAEQGQGKRATLLSDYTFAVRAGDEFVNVGKAYSGLTDAEVKELTRSLRRAAIDKFGRVMLVRPEMVLEVAFDGVQKSARHKAGYALRFPRILRWRQDKTAAEVDDVARVRELYESSLAGFAAPKEAAGEGQ